MITHTNSFNVKELHLARHFYFIVGTHIAIYHKRLKGQPAWRLLATYSNQSVDKENESEAGKVLLFKFGAVAVVVCVSRNGG